MTKIQKPLKCCELLPLEVRTSPLGGAD